MSRALFVIILAIFFSWGCAPAPPPNFIILIADDLAYSDLALYADTGLVTPNLERMAEGGMLFTDFYSASGACSPSRASLLTGMYPPKTDVTGVLMPQSQSGLQPETFTLAEMLHQNGYATACYGKWHLGHLEPYLPENQGFEEYFGIPYSNDMTPDASKNPNPYARRHPPLPLVEGTTTIETEPDQRYLTRRYTERAMEFIEDNSDKPFFLFLPYAAPHMPLFVSEEFENASGRGLYSDVLLEIDWSVGQIIDVLEEHEIDHSTAIFFTSDNGPWLVKGSGSGVAKPLREGKGTTFEGGHRVPFLAYWPGTIPSGTVSNEMVTMMDFMPTISALVNSRSDSISWDGYDISELLRGTPAASSPYEAFFFFQGRNIQAVRTDNWKLHIPHRYRSIHGATYSSPIHPGAYVQDSIGLALFDLSTDIGERNNLVNQHPEVTRELLALVDSAQVAVDTYPNEVTVGQ